MKGTFCFAWFLLLTLSATAQEYLWPTAASQFIASSFMESRPRRFHAGIDITTWKQVGFKVFAVRSGYLERMVISPFGYGRVLYHRLDTGETAVYAHLQAFNEKLQAIAEREQERVGRYSIEKFFPPEALPIKQGEVIAYTGQSGIGVPHLHFELRDARNRPFNPLLRGFKLVDNIPPTITALAVSPLTPGAMVNEDFLPIVLRPQRQNGTWRIPEVIRISGKVGVAVDVFDQAEGTENRFGIYRLQLFVDDSLQFQAQYNSFDYAQNKLSELDRDFLLKRRGWGQFQRLYRVTGNTLGLYSSLNPADGALMTWPDDSLAPMSRDQIPEAKLSADQTFQPLTALSWGEHRLRVVVEDFKRNRSIVEAVLLVGYPFILTPQVIDSQLNRLLIKPIPLPTNREIRKVEVAVANRNDRTMISAWRPLVTKWKELVPVMTDTTAPFLADALLGMSGSTANSASSDTSAPLQSQQVLELHPNGGQLLRLVAVDQYGLRSHPAFIYTRPARTMMTPLLINVERDFYPNYLRLLVRANQPLAVAPTLTFLAGGKKVQAECIPQQPHRYIASVPLADIAGDSVKLEVVAENQFGQQETWAEWFVNVPVHPGRGRSLFAPDARMRVAFSDNSLYAPLYGRVSIDTLTRISDHRVIGPIYHVEPQDVPLSNAAVVTISYPDTVSQPRQLGICYHDREQWVFIDNKLNPANQTVSARVFSLEDFAMIRDSEPPMLSIQTPRAGAVLSNRRPLISVGVDDSTSGFESEEAIELRIDDQRLIAEYDPERDVVQYRPKRDLTPGIHKLTVRAEDRCGNVARQEIEFTIR